MYFCTIRPNASRSPFLQRSMADPSSIGFILLGSYNAGF